MSDKIVYKNLTLDLVLNNAKDSYYYAKDILNGRFELGEKVISRSIAFSYWYARDVLKGRFELGEEAIAKGVWYAYMYARDVLRGRFKLGEKAIIAKEIPNHPTTKLYYQNILLASLNKNRVLL